MSEKTVVEKPAATTGDDVSKEFVITFLDLEGSPVYVVRHLRISAVGIEAKLVGKITKKELEELDPCTIYYNGKFVAEEITG